MVSSTQPHEDGHGISPCPDAPTEAQDPISNDEAMKERNFNKMKNSTEESEVASHPQGIRFAILFVSILAGDFFVGYVRYQLKDIV